VGRGTHTAKWILKLGKCQYIPIKRIIGHRCAH
jgi:hypothetical protein